MMCLVLSKLPGHTRERWNRSVMSIRRRYSREPDFADLIHFVEDESTLVNDPLFSKEALSKRGSSKKEATKDICQIIKFLSIVSKGS